VIAAIDALAERMRSTADHVPAGARRADALVHLVEEACSRQSLPTRGGLPVSLTVTLERTALGDPVWSTSRGHLLTDAESRWVSCDAAVTPVLVEPARGECPDSLMIGPAAGGMAAGSPTPAQRIAALAAALFDTRLPLAVGRTSRTATPAQRRVLAARDRGCIIPGCIVAPDACQTHHLVEWADGGPTDVDNCVLLCWAHHRQVDLKMWRIDRVTPEHPPHVAPCPNGAPGTTWPANNGAPFTVKRTPRTTWRT
jgi:HNH endonuclease